MTFHENGRVILDHLQTYLNEAYDRRRPVVRQRSIQTITDRLKLETLIKEGGLDQDALDEFAGRYLSFTTCLHHPGYFAHQVGVPHPVGALGSLMDGLTNNPMAIYEMGPAAAAIEFFMINYLLKKIGWVPMPEKIERRLTYPHGSGLLTHGGSLANLTALLAARHQLDPSVRETGNPGDLVILAPEACHYSIGKAVGIMGMGEQSVIPLDTDRAGRITVSKLTSKIQSAHKDKKRIVALVANGCATGTGLYDPIDEIADLCREIGIWFHVDGAHGAAALFSKTHAGYLKGIEKADSMIIDAHKMLRTPTICAALLVKNADVLDTTFENTSSYLFHEKKQPGFDFIGQTIECTKAGLGLKFFMSFSAMGENGMAAYIDGTYDLARQAWSFIDAQPDFETAVKPESNILCFRVDGPDELQIRLRDLMIDEGRFHISSTRLNGRRYLRIVVMNPQSDMSDIIALIDSIRDKLRFCRRTTG